MLTKKRVLALSCFMLALLPGLTPSLAAQTVQHGPTTVRSDVHHDVSPPLRDMIRNAPPPSFEEKEAEPVRRIPLPPGLSELSEDPIRQRMMVPLTPLVSQSFEGLGQGQYGFTVHGVPPDTNGAVGATQYVQWVNKSFAIFDKSTFALVAGPTEGNTLWLGFGDDCEINNDGDPIALYDKLANRWVMSQFSVSTTPYRQCIAVSTTSDATGTWYRYSFQYNDFDDYPKMGVWSDAYYETFNLFDDNKNFIGSDACAYDRTAMLSGLPATQQCFPQNSSVGGLLPSDVDGTTPPPAGSPNYMVYFGTNNLILYKFHVDFNTPSNSTFTGPTVINVAAFSPLCGGGMCVPQPGTDDQLDSLADRLMYRLAYRNFTSHESLVVNHSVAVSGGGGVRWYEIQNPLGTPVLAQQGTFAPDSTYRWMGSVAMDQAGNLAVGYSKSSSSVYPSIAFAGRIPTDPASTLESETEVVDGSGSQATWKGRNRWGDYSAMTVDPVDDCTFWYTQEYIKSNGAFVWNTRIANFKFSNCPSYTLTVAEAGTGSGTVTSTDGFINCGNVCSYTYNGGTQVTLTATPSQGSSFTSWSGCDSTQSNSCTVTMNSARTVTATFTQITYLLMVSKAGTGLGTVSSSDGFINCGNVCSYTYNSGTQVALTATPAQGSWFSGWSGCDSMQGNTCTVTMNNSRTVTATFQPTYLLSVSKAGTGLGTVSSSDGFINCGKVCSYTYNSGTQVTLTATPEQGSAFTSWSGCDSVNGNSCTVTMYSARIATATFTEITYTLSVSKAGTGLGTVSSSDGFIHCGNVCSHTYNSGTQVTLTATPSPGSSFSSWSGCDLNNGNRCTVTMNEGRTATATFTLQAGYYKLSVSTSGGGKVTSTDGFINCPGSCNYVYQSNTQVMLNAIPSQGWTFVGWNGACTGTGPCNLTMTQSLSVGASFIFGVAVYNSTLGAPECAVAGRSCDSGPWLLLGKDNMAGGAEPNQPNTIHSSCADGTSGALHVDESIDRLVVATTNGLSMAQGSIVKISATVWVADTTQDALDLYYATSANNPTWTYITTLVPRANGSQTLSALFRLRPGPLQAVRANFRKGESRSSCSPGDYDDHDDLAFAVR